MMLEVLLLMVGALVGWLFARRQRLTEPPVTPPKKQPESPKFEDKIDEVSKPKSYSDSDDDLASWLDEHARKRK